METLNNLSKKNNNISNKKNTELFDMTSIYLFLLIVLILFVLFIKYSFNNYNKNTIDEYEHKITKEIKQMPYCININDPLEEYVLADYIIKSSYNSFLLGNQKYGYCSLDMIKSVLESGSRYIELQVCKYGINYGDPPVIGTGDKIGSWINSINYLNVEDVFKVIKRNYNYINAKKINHPLIIYINLKISDTETLNNLERIISNTIGNLLLKPNKYYNYPISLEKMCILNNKIIIISKNDYENTNLKKIFIPTYQYIQRIYYKDFNKYIIKPDPKNPNVYNNTFSKKNEIKSLNEFNSEYPNFKSIFDKKNIFDDIIKNENIINKLEAFNKIGIMIITPHKDDDVFTLNHNTDFFLDYGCTITPLNFQVNDSYLKNYLEIFEDSLFVLKSTNLRFKREREKIEDINSLFPINQYQINYISDFINNFGDEVYTIQPMNNITKYISSINKNTLLLKGKNNKTKKISSNEGFVFEESKKYPGTIKIRNIKNKKYFYIYNNDIILKKNSNTEEFHKLSSFYPVKGLDEEDDSFSFKTIDDDKQLYLSLFNNKLKVAVFADKINMRNSSSFILTKQDSEKLITIRSIDKSYLKLYRSLNEKNEKGVGGSLLFSTNKYLDEDNYFKIEGDFPKGEFYLKGSNNLYMIGYQGISPTITNKNKIYASTFYLKKNINFFSILTKDDQFLNKNYLGAPSFNKDKELLQPPLYENGELISPAIFGPNLKNSKLFVINITYKLL